MPTAHSAHSDRAPSPVATAAARDLIILFRRLRARLRQLPAGGLSVSQNAVLSRLHSDGASSTTGLALAEGVRSQSMTVTLNVLADHGLIERTPDPDDGRRQIVTLSAAGRRKVLADKQGRNDWLAQTMDHRYSAAQLATITEALVLLGELVEQ